MHTRGGIIRCARIFDGRPIDRPQLAPAAAENPGGKGRARGPLSRVPRRGKMITRKSRLFPLRVRSVFPSPGAIVGPYAKYLISKAPCNRCPRACNFTRPSVFVGRFNGGAKNVVLRSVSAVCPMRLGISVSFSGSFCFPFPLPRDFDRISLS